MLITQSNLRLLIQEELAMIEEQSALFIQESEYDGAILDDETPV